MPFASALAICFFPKIEIDKHNSGALLKNEESLGLPIAILFAFCLDSRIEFLSRWINEAVFKKNLNPESIARRANAD